MPYCEEVAEDELTYEIIGYAIEVHKELGPHQPEHLYRDGLCAILEDEGFAIEREHEIDIMVRGRKIGSGYIDILVADEVVLELKAVKKTTDDHFNQLGRNVRAAGVRRGLLLNFGESTMSTRRWINADLMREEQESRSLGASERAEIAKEGNAAP